MNHRKQLAIAMREEILHMAKNMTVDKLRNLHVIDYGDKVLCLDFNREFVSVDALKQKLSSILKSFGQNKLNPSPDNRWDYILEDGVEGVGREFLNIPVSGGGLLGITVFRKIS